MTHFLNSRFAFFYLRRDRSQKETDAQGYQNAVQKIGSFDSVEGFFGIYDHLVKPHSLTSETHVTDYHLFREGISPTWEDPKNRNGGKYKFGGGVVDHAHGAVFCVPSDAGAVLRVDCATETVAALGEGALPRMKNKWQNGVVGPSDGCVYAIPADAPCVLNAT